MSAASIHQTISEFAEGVEIELDAARDKSIESLCVILASLRECKRDLSVIEGQLVEEIGHLAGSRRSVIVEGLGYVEIKRAKTYSEWKNEDLTRVLVARALDERKLNEATGEYEPAHEAVARVLSDCARPSWRVTSLRGHGVQIDEFCTVNPGKLAVRLP